MTGGMVARRVVGVVAPAASLARIPLAKPASAQPAAFPKVFIAVLRGANEVPAADPHRVAPSADIADEASATSTSIRPCSEAE